MKIILHSHKIDGAIERYGIACFEYGPKSDAALEIREEINKMIDEAPLAQDYCVIENKVLQREWNDQYNVDTRKTRRYQ